MKVFMQTKEEECKVHGGYEAIFIAIGDGRWTGCPSCAKARQEEYEKVAQYQFQEERHTASKNYALRNAKIPMRMAGETFDTYEIVDEHRDEQLVALQDCKEFAQQVVDHTDGGKCLVMIGKPGTGKTHLACAIIQDIVDKDPHFSCRYISMGEVVSRVYATYGANALETEGDVIEYMSSMPLLVIDEVGASTGTENKMNIMFSVLNNRYNRCLPTIMIGNVTFNELAQALGERVIDRLSQIGKSVKFTWQSHRGIK